MAKKKKPAVKKKPAKRTQRKRAKSKKSPAEKPKRKGVIGSAVGKIPERVRIKGGKSKYKSKHGTIETSYEDLEVGK